MSACELAGLEMDVYDFTTNNFMTLEVAPDESAFNAAIRLTRELERLIEEARAEGKELLRLSLTWFSNGERARRWLVEDERRLDHRSSAFGGKGSDGICDTPAG